MIHAICDLVMESRPNEEIFPKVLRLLFAKGRKKYVLIWIPWDRVEHVNLYKLLVDGKSITKNQATERVVSYLRIARHHTIFLCVWKQFITMKNGLLKPSHFVEANFFLSLSSLLNFSLSIQFCIRIQFGRI